MRDESLPPWPKGCGPPWERSRIDPWTVRDAKLVPTRFLIENFGDFGASDVDLRPFWVPKRVSGGSSGRVFRPFFPDAVLHRLVVVFSVKNVKLEKMKKCVSICKLHTILKVAPSKKIRCLCEKTLSIQTRFSVKNRAKIGPESDSARHRREKTT